MFAGALQATAGGAFATLLVQIGFVDPVGAAAAIAVTWLLLLPLPQRSRWGSCSAWTIPGSTASRPCRGISCSSSPASERCPTPLANGDRRSLVVPAFTLGVVTGPTNQVLLRLVGLDPLWASSIRAIVLGIVTVPFATRTGSAPTSRASSTRRGTRCASSCAQRDARR